MSDATWMDADLDELRMLYADRLRDLEYEYGLRCAYENAVNDAMRNNPYSDEMLADAWNRCAIAITEAISEFFMSQ